MSFFKRSRTERKDRVLKSENERIVVLRIKKAVGTTKCKTVDIFALVSSKLIRSADYMLSSNIEGALTGHFDYIISCAGLHFLLDVLIS